MEYLVLTVQASQKIDIWLRITQLVSDMDCHICNMQGQKLAGENAFIALVSGNWNTIAKLENALKRIDKDEDISIKAKRSKSAEESVQLLPYFVEILGLNEPGMLFHLFEFFSNEGISAENLQAESYVSNATNAPMFSLKVSIGIPSQANIGDLRERFILFCEDLNIDGAIEPDKR